MKKAIRLLALLLLFGMTLVSCREKKSEWSTFYNYSLDDIAGTYSYSNEPKAFDVVSENEDIHICEDATINIQKLSGTTVSFDINCREAEFTYSFVGRPAKNNNDFMIQLSSGYIFGYNGKITAYNVQADVYKNAQAQTRLHGFASFDTYKVVNEPEQIGSDTVVDRRVAYFFDVIKN